MATTIAAICLFAVVLCIPLVLLKPAAVFYIFIFFKVFENLFAGYIYAAGNLGLPRTWTPGDFLFWLTLFAAVFINNPKIFEKDRIEKSLYVLLLLCSIAMAQGLFLYAHSAFTFSRIFHFFAAFLFGIKYFTDYSKAKRFLIYTVFLVTLMLVVQVFIRFGVLTPPTADLGIHTTLLGERGTNTLVPLLYIPMVAIGMGMLINKKGYIKSGFVLLVAGAGLLLSETRSTYGAVAVLLLCALLFGKNRIRNLIFGVLGAMLLVMLANMIGFDFLERFKGDGIPIPLSEQVVGVFKGTMGRAEEYLRVVQIYKENPVFVLFGRGFGALHNSVIFEDKMVAYWHSEYLGWIDRCGLIGIAIVLYLYIACLYRSLISVRSRIPELSFLGMITFLLTISLVAEGVFHPILANQGGSVVIVCFFAIMGNWQYFTDNPSGQDCLYVNEDYENQHDLLLPQGHEQNEDLIHY